MSRATRWLAAAAAVAAVASIVAVFVPSASAAASTKCPSGGTPAPGSTITGGLEVDGFCTLTDVTVEGAIRVDSTPAAQLACCGTNAPVLNGSTVTGGIVVENGSGVASGIDLDTGNLTHNRSTINGGITLNTPCCFILAETTVRGGITMTGGYDWSSICDGDPFCFSSDPICGNQIYGNVTIRNDDTEQVFLGDPREQFFANANCEANTIHGSVFLMDSNFIRFDGEPSEIEGETITGSVHVDHSTAEVNENTIGGSLLCTNGAVIHTPPPPPDIAGNTVRGRDTCD